MRRVVVIGSSCAGKTTFARALAGRLGVPMVELDALHWGSDWTPRDEAFVADVAAAVAGEAWVIEGGYSRVRGLVWGRADAVVWLDYPMTVVVGRAVRRTLSRSWSGVELWNGNRESFRKSFCDPDSILLWVLTSWRRKRHQFEKLWRRPEYAHLRKLRFRDPRTAERWLAAVSLSACRDDAAQVVARPGRSR